MVFALARRLERIKNMPFEKIQLEETEDYARYEAAVDLGFAYLVKVEPTDDPNVFEVDIPL